MELFTTEALANWLRNQPSDQEYVWSDPVFCLMGPYLADNGSCWGEQGYSDMPNYEVIAGQKPWTYGAALGRAEKVLALPPPPLQIEASRELETVDAG